MFKYIIAEGLEIRLLELHHAEAIFKLVDMNREYLKKWMPWVDATKAVEDSIEFIKYGKKQYAENNGLQGGIFYHSNLVGIIGFHSLDFANGAASMGYWLDAQHQGKGIMTKATEALVSYALVDMGLNRVEIRCGKENKKSAAIPERLGFVKEGLIRDAEKLYDHYVDHVIYGMLARDWKK